MSHVKPLGVGVIGLGVMGRTHIKAYQAAAAKGLPCTLVAVCSANAAELSGLATATGNLSSMAGAERVFDPSVVRTTRDPAMVAAAADVDIVSICTPTDSHADLAVTLLRAGKHVLVEKPVAITSAEVKRVAAAAATAKRVCMPGMCMRFWPGWDWLEESVASGSFGRVISANFTRVGSKPGWSREFYHDPARTGGAMFDLHVHDADFILWLFRRTLGMPRSVRSMGSIDHITTMYDFGPSGPRHVVAEGAWVSQPGFPFRMRYTIEFEHMIADWDLSRPDQLLLVERGSARSGAALVPPGSAYEREIEHFVRIVAEDDRAKVTLDDAVRVTALLEAERESLETGRAVEVREP
jgi:predicted dehydrogenase